MQEETEISALVSSIDPTALPLVVVIIALSYLYFKFKQIKDDRVETKQHRDADSQNIHDEVLKLNFKVTNLEGRIELHDTVLSDINKQINILNTNLAILTEKIDNLTNTLNEVKNDRQIQSK